MTRDVENFKKLNPYMIGKYDIPTLSRDEINLDNIEFIPFNFAKSCKNAKGKGIHFFIDDYQFQRVWNDIDRYIPMFSRFEYVCTPDFSLYTDYPVALQIYNHYRKQWIGSYLQSKGIKVIPTVAWSDKNSFEWCFDGIPKEATVAVSSIGTQNNNRAKEGFIKGYNEMLNRLEPKQILFYGKVPDECEGNIVNIKSFYDKFDEIRKEGG